LRTAWTCSFIDQPPSDLGPHDVLISLEQLVSDIGGGLDAQRRLFHLEHHGRYVRVAPPAAKLDIDESAVESWLFNWLKASLSELRNEFPGACVEAALPSTAPAPLSVLAPDTALTPVMLEAPDTPEMPLMAETAPMGFIARSRLAQVKGIEGQLLGSLGHGGVDLI
jgi:hypothetical protein